MRTVSAEIVQPGGDLLAGESLGQQVEDVPLALGQNQRPYRPPVEQLLDRRVDVAFPPETTSRSPWTSFAEMPPDLEHEAGRPAVERLGQGGMAWVPV